MPGTSPEGSGLRRSLSVWQAIGLSIALMAPSMAANINPQASAATAGRRGANVLLSVEGATVALILIVTAIVFARRLGVALTASEGIAAGGPATRAEELPASDAAGGYTSSA